MDVWGDDPKRPVVVTVECDHLPGWVCLVGGALIGAGLALLAQVVGALIA